MRPFHLIPSLLLGRRDQPSPFYNLLSGGRQDLHWASFPNWIFLVPSAAPFKTCSSDPSQLRCHSLNKLPGLDVLLVVRGSKLNNRWGAASPVPSREGITSLLLLALLFLVGFHWSSWPPEHTGGLCISSCWPAHPEIWSVRNLLTLHHWP